jgi:hypothetical protein
MTLCLQFRPLILLVYFFRVSDFSYLLKMTLPQQGTPWKSILPSEVSKWIQRNCSGNGRVGSLMPSIINRTLLSLGHEPTKSRPEHLSVGKILGGPMQSSLFIPVKCFFIF